MNFNQQINFLRHQLHRSIVHLAIRAGDPGSDDDLVLNDPLEACYRFRDYSGQLVTVGVTVTGVNGTTGDLIAEVATGQGKKLYYNDLTLEQLARLHEHLEAGLYKIENTNDRNIITAG
jgi:hypothetical protein